MDTLKDIKKSIIDLKTPISEIEDARYHYNADYENAADVCIHGILTLDEQNERGIRNDSVSVLETLGDIDSHINGTDAVSLSVTGLTDLYEGEDVYDSSSPMYVDFRVSNSVDAYRTTTHYGNEFLHYGNVDSDKLKAIDIRFLRLLELVQQRTRFAQLNQLDEATIIKDYNYLIDLAKALSKRGLIIPVRELSETGQVFNLDIDRLKERPKLK